MSVNRVNTSKLLAVLQELGVEKVDDYERKLRDNAGSAEVSRDLVAEGHAAAMLAVGGLRVEIGDSPDLALRAGGQLIGAEVKHFRRKRQDARDEGRLLKAFGDGVLETYGDTVP